jgi:hypothetical protein
LAARFNGGGALTLERCTLTGNAAARGGAIYSTTSGITEMKHCTLSGNSATSVGGAIENNFGSTRLTHCTVSNNIAPTGAGGGVARHGYISTETVVEKSIIAGNTDSDVDLVLSNVVNSFTSFGHNLIGTGNATARFNLPGDTINNTAAGIKLAQLDDYGGPMLTMLPLPGSPAIDAGAAPGEPTDQRGAPRVVDGHGLGGAIADIGAAEFIGTAGFVDTDGDDMDDRLEPLWGFTVGVPDGAGDADGDGSTNAQELGNRTSPRDANSMLRIVGFTFVGLSLDSDPVFDVKWTSFPGLNYTIQAKTDLNFGIAPRQAGPFTATDFTHSELVELDKNNPKDFLRIRRN